MALIGECTALVDARYLFEFTVVAHARGVWPRVVVWGKCGDGPTIVGDGFVPVSVAVLAGDVDGFHPLLAMGARFREMLDRNREPHPGTRTLIQPTLGAPASVVQFTSPLCQPASKLH